MNTEFIQKTVSQLPSYWKLATIRCSIYALVVGSNAFMAGVEGYTSLSDISGMAKVKLLLNVIVAMAGVWLAFLDTSLQKIDKTSQPDTTAPKPN
jgi:hypothetical protein